MMGVHASYAAAGWSKMRRLADVRTYSVRFKTKHRAVIRAVLTGLLVVLLKKRTNKQTRQTKIH
jgi:hypothetical protein